MSDVVVVGGGLAGITAALRLADAGRSVTLLESKPRLGGLTTSFTRACRVGSSTVGLSVDTGQHVFLRCCTSYLDLLERLGVRDQVTLQPRLDVPVVTVADGRRVRLRRDTLPVVAGIPLHLARTLLGYRGLGWRDRLAAARAIRALAAVEPGDPATDGTSFGDWLVRHGQSPAAIRLLWELIGVATLNARAADASLASAATVFRIGLLSGPDAADIGWAAVPLGRLHGDAAVAALSAAGVDVQVRRRVKALHRANRSSSWTVRVGDGQAVTASTVVVAADPVATEQLLPAGLLPLPPGWSRRLGATPIINAHFILDRPVLDQPMLAVPDSPLQFLFDRTASSGLATGAPGAQHVVASISAADGFAGRPVGELRAHLEPELHRALPAVKSARLLDFFVTREPHATWRQAPGQAAHRPPTASRAPGLFLAGAHVATGWPATMEGAVRSGEAAAAAVLATAGSPAGAPPYPNPTRGPGLGPSEDAAA